MAKEPNEIFFALAFLNRPAYETRENPLAHRSAFD